MNNKFRLYGDSMEQYIDYIKKIEKANREAAFVLHFEEEGNTLIQILNEDIPFVLSHLCRRPGNALASLSFLAPGHSFQTQLPYHELALPLQHHHSGFEFMFVLDGEICHHIEKHEASYGKGHCCILDRNINHIEHYGEHFDIYFCLFSKEYLQSLLLSDDMPDLGSSVFFRQLLCMVSEESSAPASANHSYFDFVPNDAVAASDVMSHYLELLWQELKSPCVGSSFMIKGQTARIIGALGNPVLYGSTRIDCQISQQEYIFTKIKLAVESRKGDITRSELTELLNYNGDYLNRILKKRTGMNITQFRWICLLNEAALRLSETDDDINTILKDLHISNHTYFYQLFKEKYGITPLSYRIRNRSGYPSENNS